MNYKPIGAIVSIDRCRKTLTRLRRISSSDARENGQAHHSQKLWGLNFTRVHCVASSFLFTRPGTV